MDHRLGTCVACKAHYRVPATFTANRARCKNCGGAVEIGPVQSAAAPGKAFGSAGMETGPPVSPGGAGMGVKPSIPPPTTGVTGGDAGTPADKPSPVKPVPAKAPPPMPAAKPARPAAAKPAVPPRAAAGGVRGAAERAATRVRSEPTAKAAAAARVRRSQPVRKKNWGVLLGAAALLIMAIAAAVFMFNRSSEPVQANESGKAPPAAPASAGTGQGAVETPQAESAPALAASEPETPEEGAEAPPPEPIPEATPEDVDLSALPDQEPLPETSAEDAAEMREWMATFVDPAAGAAGRRAGDRLVAKGKEAFPVILNTFKRIDLTTEEGFRAGDTIQRELLMRICNGNNVGWQYPEEKGYLLYDKKAIRTWFKLWGEAKDDPKKWAKLAKLDAKDAEAAESKAKSDTLDDF